jgi:segregation and condensation protein B
MNETSTIVAADEVPPAEPQEGEPGVVDPGSAGPEAEDEGPEEEGRLGPGAELDDEELLRQVAALLFASAEPLSLGRLVKLLERPERARVQTALETLGARLASAGLPIEVRGLRGGSTLLTSADVGQVVGRLAKGAAVERISAAALETLSIVAYRQPVTKAEVEAIRGVQAGPVLRALVDRGLVKVVGRADVPGHPLQYATTPVFLDRFGLMSEDELPRDAELARG